MIILHFQNVSISRTSNLRSCPPYRSLISRTSAWDAICLSFSSKKKIKPAIADRRFIGLYIISLRKQPTFPDMPFSGWRRKVFHLATTSAACQQAVPSRVASEASRVRTRECRKVARPFYPPSSLSLESLPFVCRSRVTFHVTPKISIHQLKTLLQETTWAVTSSSCKFTCWVQ